MESERVEIESGDEVKGWVGKKIKIIYSDPSGNGKDKSYDIKVSAVRLAPDSDQEAEERHYLGEIKGDDGKNYAIYRGRTFIEPN